MKKLLLVLALLIGFMPIAPCPSEAVVNEVDPARADYTGDGTTTVFVYPFRVTAAADIRVLVNGTAQVLNTNYSVSGVGNNTGNITFVTAPATAATITILRDQPVRQATSYPPGAGFSATRLEGDLDKNIMVDQMQQEQINRALKYPETLNPSAGQTTVPVPEVDKCLGWNAMGDLSARDCSGGSGGGAGGDVTAVVGTANEITSTNSDGPIPTISIADVFRITGKTVTAPMKVVTTLPVNCTVGDQVFKSDATAGQNLYGCTALDTWTQQAGGGGGGGSGDLTDVLGTVNQITITNGTGPQPTVALAAELDLTGKQLLGQQPLVFEGATNNNVTTTIVIVDPTANRTLTVPNANSVTVQPLTCATGTLVSSIDANGLPACAAPTGGIVDAVTADVTVSNTTTETNLYSYTVPANTMGSNGTLRFEASGTFSCQAGRTLTFRPKFGGTTLATKVITCDTSDGDTTAPWVAVVDLSSDGSTSLQISTSGWAITTTGADGGGKFASLEKQEIARGTAAINTTSSAALVLTAQWNNANSANSVTLEYARTYKIGSLGGGGGAGDIESVTAGPGLSGGGPSGAVQLDWSPGTFVNNISLWDASQASRSITANLSGATDPVITFANNSIEITTGALTAGVGGSITATAFSDAGMTALAAFNTNGLIAQTANDTYAGRTITGVSGETVIANGDGVSGNPLIGLADAFTLAGHVSTIPWKTGTTPPATCSTGMAFFDTDSVAGTNLNLCTSANTWTTISGSGSGTGHQIQEEGSGLTARAGLNFIGNSITAADDSGNNRTNVTLSQSPSASTSVVGTGRTITTNSPLGGGGNLTADLTLTCTTCATAASMASGEVVVATSGTGIRSYSTYKYDGTDLSIGDVSTNYVRVVTAALTSQRTLTLPDADSVTVVPTTATSNQFLTHITSGGVQTKAQPAFTDISGTAGVGQGGTGLTTVAANRLIGTGGSVDAVQAITIGSGLSLAAGTLSATGGAGTPGGSTTQIQYNSSGAFAGNADLVFDDANSHLTVGTLVVDPDNTPRLWFDHDGTDGIISVAGVGTGAGNANLQLQVEGTGRVLVPSLMTTGAASGKSVVCVDTATGKLYASSTGTDCSN